jgi:hypothetical protein
MKNLLRKYAWPPLLFGLMLALATPFQSQATEAAPLGDMESERYEELEQGRSAYKETWVLPGTDLKGYSKVYVWDAQFEYRDVGDPNKYRNTMSRSGRTQFGITEEGRADFEKTVSEAFMKELSKGKRFEIVEEIGPDTLILRGGLLDVISNVPPESVGRTDTYLANIGEATLVIELLDAESGTVLAVVSERRKITPPGGGQINQFSQRANKVTITADVRRWASSAAAKLRKELDKAMK